jgi:hypothetical protein
MPGRPDRTFAVATDEALIGLISRARTRLVVIAPALTRLVAEALARRFVDLGKLDMTVILDSDPEVYRLGFGDPDALEAIREASARSLFDLRQQPGVRIGVIVSDDTTMVYSPISKNIEAGSTSAEKPNAIILGGAAADGVAFAAGAHTDDGAPPREVGSAALKPDKVEAMQSDLKANPPRPFDITRKLNVFSSAVQYVELEVLNYRLTTRRIPLPAELLDVTDDNLRDRMTGHIQPLQDIGKLDITVQHDGKSEDLKVDEEWLTRERKRIEDKYTFPIKNFGRVILHRDRPTFDKATLRLKAIVEKYQHKLRETLAAKQSEFEGQIVGEFRPRWEQTPPQHFARWSIKPTPDTIAQHLKELAHEIFSKAATFPAPEVKVLYKNVAPENLSDGTFLSDLRENMIAKRVPHEIIDSLFETGQAAPVAGTFPNR